MKKFEDNEDIDLNDLDEDQLYTMELIDRARSGKHSEFALITNLEEWHDIRFKIAEAKAAKKHFKDAAKILYIAYLNSLKDGIDDVETLIASRNCDDMMYFWEEEYYSLKEITSEFYAYVFTGHLLDTICGKERDEDDMFDYRFIKESGKEDGTEE